MAPHKYYARDAIRIDQVRCGTIPNLLRALANELEADPHAMLRLLRIRPSGGIPTVTSTNDAAWTVRTETETGTERWPEGTSGSCPTCDGRGGFVPSGEAYGDWADCGGTRCQTCDGTGYLSEETDR
jgi:hypothetical protein